jgi:hypothetical protein
MSQTFYEEGKEGKNTTLEKTWLYYGLDVSGSDG